jgi:hypothetical protein
LIDCGSQTIGRVEIGLTLPTDITPATVNFGPGCTPTDCTGATTMGATVDLDESFAVPGTQTTNGLADVLYVVLQGVGGPSNPQLCSPGTEVYLGSLAVTAFPTDGSTVSFTQNEISTVETTACAAGSDCFDNVALQTPSSDPIAFNEYLLVVGPVESTVDLELVPDPTDTDGVPPTSWLLLLNAEAEIHKLTIGVIPPLTSDYQEIRFEGCPNEQESTSTAKCLNAIGPYIAQGPSGPSRTFGPDPSPPPTEVRNDTMYVTLQGSLDGSYSALSLNVANPDNDPNMKALLGRIILDEGEQNEPPGLTTEGAAYLMGTGSPFILSQNLTEVGIYDYTLIGSGQVVEDTDGDRFVNGSDNCVFVPQIDQADWGGFNTSDPDFRGNACQCGDGTLDGRVMTADVDALRDVLAGKPASPSVKELCSVSGDTVCDVKDVLVLQDALDLQAPVFDPRACARSFPPGLPTDP